MAATIKDVAKLAGVSTATVSYAINNTRFVSEETREKVEKAMRELEYYPSALARGLRVRRTRTIGLIVPQLSNTYFTEVAHGIEEILQKNGYSLVISESKDDPASEKKLIQVFYSLQVDGLIMVPCQLPEESTLGSVLRDACPTVFVDRRIENFKCDAVVLDNYSSTYKVLTAMFKSGRRRIGMLLGPKEYSTTQDRLAGHKQALADAGVAFDARLIRHGDYGFESGLSIGTEILKRKNRPDAVFSASSQMTLGVFLKAREKGVRIPEELALCGCEDTGWALATDPPLSMIYQPSAELGKKAAELVLTRIESPTEKRETVFIPATPRFRGLM